MDALGSGQQCVENSASIKLLSFAADTSADDYLYFIAAYHFPVDSENISEWRALFSSLTNFWQDVVRSRPAAPDSGMWPVFF